MGAEIFEDTLQQANKHEAKHGWLKAHNVKVIRVRFDGTHKQAPVSFGDYYRAGSNVVVDTKRNVDEVAKNINGKEHGRFKRELLRAKDAGYRLIVLVENDEGITDLQTLQAWINTHCRKCPARYRMKCNPRDASTKCARHGTVKPIQGSRLAKAMATMQERYSVVFMFCPPWQAAKVVCDVLGVEYQPLCMDCFRWRDGRCLAAYGMQIVPGPAQPMAGDREMCDWGCSF